MYRGRKQADLKNIYSWHTLDVLQVQEVLDAGSKEFAPNRLQEKESAHWYLMLFQQFKSLLVVILFVAAVLSYFIGDKVDAAAIVSILLLNAVLGFVQEWKAETALQGLKKLLAPRCRVLLNGREEEIDAEALIPGDHVLLSAGNTVPADIRLVSITDLRIDESALTGESMAVRKDLATLPESTPISAQRNMAFMGTNIIAGHGEGLVVTTGMNTEFGRIAALTGSIEETQTNLQNHLAVLGRQLGILALLISGVVFFIGWLSGRDALQMAMTGISLAVAAVPEGLPAVVTITLALGMSAMARKKALLRHLQAAETLGAVSVICTDKTGTLTKNEMTVQKIWLPHEEITVGGAGYEPVGDFFRNGHIIEPQLHSNLMAFLDTGRKCNHASVEKNGELWRAIGSPTEAALVVAAEKAGLKKYLRACIIEEQAFDSTRKFMSVVEEKEDCLVSHVKGAPETLLPLCTHYQIDGRILEMTGDMHQEIQRAYTAFSKEGMRTLALAQRILQKQDGLTGKDAECGLTFLGIAGIIDPPRPEVREALQKAKSAGIRVVLITGDSPDTAFAIAEQIGLQISKVITGTVLKTMSDENLSDMLKQDILFARTVPEDKFRIVRLLQAQGQLVAMTGDGVNDAPALKQADIGIAMGIRGTDVAKGAADIVLLDDNFATIIAAIEEGRRQYTNIQKFVHFLVSHSIGEVSAVFLNILLDGPLILLPIQILWINLATDSVTALALSVERAEANIMNELPRKMNKPLLDKKSMVFLGAMGLYIGIVTMLLFKYYLTVSPASANTVAFTTIVVTAQVLVFNFRHLNGPVSSIGWFSNPWLLLAVFAMITMQAAAIYLPALQEVLHTVPLSLQDWIIIFFLAVPLFVIPEFLKYKRGWKR